MVRRCPICERDSIVGHGWRRKQAHDEEHDWIQIRRGVCHDCGKTFTLLPCFSLPYTHYSLLARLHVLHQRFVEGRCWESVVLALVPTAGQATDNGSSDLEFAKTADSAPDSAKSSCRAEHSSAPRRR
jgi:Domain of unknown function (DUF6431)